MSEADINEIEINIGEARKLVKKGEALDRLLANRDFIEIVKEGYLRDEAVRLVHLKAAPNLQQPHVQEAIVRDIDAIGSFIGYMHKLEQETAYAAQAIESNEEELEEIRREGGEQ